MKKIILIIPCLFSLLGCGEQTPKKDVAHVILMFGQSNMSGVALNERLQTRFPEDYSKVKDGFSNCQIRYSADNNHSRDVFEFSDVKLGQGTTIEHFGPEIGAALKLKENKPNETYYFIKYAIGGTSLQIDWNSPSMAGLDGRCYKDATGYADGALLTLEEKGLKPQIDSICWMQGEEDNTHQEQLVNYQINEKLFIQDLRSKYDKYAPETGIKFLDAGISDAWTNYVLLNNAKKEVAKLSNMNFYIDTIELGLEYDKEPTPENPDRAHFDSKSQLKLGIAFASYF